MAHTSAMWKQAAHSTYQLPSRQQDKLIYVSAYTWMPPLSHKYNHSIMSHTKSYTHTNNNSKFGQTLATTAVQVFHYVYINYYI